jgi:2,5-dioxopentanoate dehydrogenase
LNNKHKGLYMSHTLHGQHIIGGVASAESTTTFQGYNPADGSALPTAFHEGTSDEVDRAATLAAETFDAFRSAPASQRADLLDAIADEIMALGDDLLERCGQETGLPRGRLEGERGRTVGQAKLFANVLRDGNWVNARIDTAIPDRAPVPKPDLRMMMMPLGPIAVFGASNFPLAISVAGTDTVSALGVGCPVVVKSHPGHPGTCELMAVAIHAALAKVGLPAGAFSLIQGAGHEVGLELVKHPAIKAVGFTGSLVGGRALFDVAAARPEPIPVYAEMGSSNPVFILPGVLADRGETLAQGYVGSVTLGVGQFCTNPGIVLGLESDDLDGFVDHVQAAASAAAPATMLHAGIHKAYEAGIAGIADTSGVETVGVSDADAGTTQAKCAIYKTDVATFEANANLHDEVFGPSSLIVAANTIEDLERIAEKLDGHLTATIHGSPEDLVKYSKLVRILERKVGRLLFGGFPTGVEVCPSQNHGGPYPASTDPHFTSIGTASLYRFVRPISYQGFSQEALPAELRDKNEKNIIRMVNGELTASDVS